MIDGTVYRRDNNGMLSAQEKDCSVFCLRHSSVANWLLRLEVEAWQYETDAKAGKAALIIRVFEIPINDTDKVEDFDDHLFAQSSIVSNTGEICNFVGTVKTLTTIQL